MDLCWQNNVSAFNMLSQFSSVSLIAQSCPTLSTPWLTAHQASLSITNTRSSPKLMRIESEMPSSHLILCHPLLLLPPIPPSIRVFSNESTLCMRWPKYWSFRFSISPSKGLSWVQSQKHKMVCSFPSKPFNVTVIQVYAPTSNAEKAEVDWFYVDL